MAIKFKCPHCDKALSVKDDSLAGKKVGCPKCRKVVVIPRPEPAAAPDEDVEALAAAALAEPKPDPATTQQSQTIDFECPQCGEQIHMSRDLGGKNAPCPECRRVIRVPVPKTKDPADWRKKDDHLPTGARRDTEPAPEGAWEPSRAKGVSTEALLEAGVIAKKKKPGLTRRQKITRGIAAGAVAVAVLVGGIFAWSAWAHNREGAMVESAVKSAEDGDRKEAAAEANRAAGEYYLRTGGRDTVEKAKTHLAKARDLLEKSKPGAERDALLADLLVSQADLGGGDDEAARGMRLKWADALKELKQTLSHVTTSGGRLHALRQVSRRLIARNRFDEANQLGRQGAARNAGEGADADALAYEGPEALAVVGLEFLRANDKVRAGQLADGAARMYDPNQNQGQDGPPPVAPSVVALCLALGKPEPKPGKAKDDENLYKIGQAAGLALKGDASAARSITADKPEWLFQIKAAVADATGDAADVDAAIALLDGDPPPQPVSSWLVFRLVQVSAKPGQTDRVLKLAERIGDPGLKTQAQLEAVRLRLEEKKDKADDGALSGLDGGAVSQALGRERLARHNARVDGGTLKTVEGWDAPVRPFGQLGAVLGVQDAKGK